jgi:hypothetical protein
VRRGGARLDDGERLGGEVDSGAVGGGHVHWCVPLSPAAGAIKRRLKRHALRVFTDARPHKGQAGAQNVFGCVPGFMVSGV